MRIVCLITVGYFTGLPSWTAAGYYASITGSGAFKLADYSVAPITAEP